MGRRRLRGSAHAWQRMVRPMTGRLDALEMVLLDAFDTDGQVPTQEREALEAEARAAFSELRAYRALRGRLERAVRMYSTASSYQAASYVAVGALIGIGAWLAAQPAPSAEPAQESEWGP